MIVCMRKVISFDGVAFLSRYPKIMTDEGVRVVRQWLGSTNTIEEGMWTSRAHVGFFLTAHICVVHLHLAPLGADATS